MILFLGLFLTFLSGWLFFSLFEKISSAEKIIVGASLSFPLLSLGMFLLGILEIPLTFFSVVTLLLVLNLVLFLLALKEKKLSINLPNFYKIKSLNPLEITIILSILLLFLASLILNLYWPPYEWDALSLYDFRAQRFLESYSLAQNIFTSFPPLTTYNYSYPFFSSLLHTFIYLFSGKNPQFLYTIFYILFISFFYLTLKKKISRTKTLLFTLFLAGMPSFFLTSLIPYTNIPYILYFFISIVYLLGYFDSEGKRQDLLLLSAIFLGVTTFIRTTEPLWLVNLVFVSYFSLRYRKIRNLLLFLLIFFLWRQTWVWYRDHLYAFTPGEEQIVDITTLKFQFDLKRVPSIAAFVNNVFVGKRYLVVGFILVLIFKFLKKEKDWILPGLIFTYFLIIFVGTYFLSFIYNWWYAVPDSARRMSMFMIPLLLYSISLIFQEEKK